MGGALLGWRSIKVSYKKRADCSFGARCLVELARWTSVVLFGCRITTNGYLHDLPGRPTLLLDRATSRRSAGQDVAYTNIGIL